MENNQRNSRKRLNSLILLVAFTAIMLIVSTYAWFSAQKTVTLGGLQGKVNVAEGLEISLDAKHWSQEIDFSKYTDQNKLKRQYAVKTDGTIEADKTYDDGNLTHETAGYKDHNIIPSELLPVSTTGTSGNGIGLTDMNMYRGIVTSGLKDTNSDGTLDKNVTTLSDIITVHKDTTSYTAYDGENTTTVALPSHHDYSGYYAIDFFLRNSTKTTEAGTTNYSEILQLNTNSKLELKNSNALTTGLQNTVRVAFAAFNALGEAAPDKDGNGTVSSEEWAEYLAKGTTTASNYMTASQSQILNAYLEQNIRDVAIWEPNTSDHVQYIVNNNTTTPEYSLADTKLYIDSGATVAKKGLSSTSQAMRTYALTTAADTANTVDDIYNWDSVPSGLEAQVALQTEKKGPTDYAIADGVKNLVSVTSPVGKKYTTGDSTTESGVVNFKIGDGTVAKIRMYVWLEGQDIDCVNYASHGGGIDLDIGLLKDGEVGQS